MASSEDVIRSAVPGGIAKPLILALLASLRLALCLDEAAKKVLPLRGPKRHRTREPVGYSEDWAGWWTNFRREGWAI
jgi:hypothetical protein